MKVSLHPAQAAQRLLAEPGKAWNPHLHDTALGLARLRAGDCTSGASGKPPARRHLPCPLSQLTIHSRDEPPDGRGPAFAWSDVVDADATPIHLITRRPSLLPSSCARTPIGTSCDAPTRKPGERRGFHVALTSHQDDVGARLSAGGSLVCARTGEKSWTNHAPFGSSLPAPLACSGLRRLAAIHFPLTISSQP